ncbi:MAG TPA: poly-beta-1,6-N-acetyl-D-glucosamine biosynthesis protein PgaD, partial [Marinobacter sp.]|nr:poly-beta-1,6-N-acetyl-D-glucosamine biosynthesis protein PgaD [Marinobacter sp.]
MKTPLIIERPELQTPTRKTLSSVITFLAWTLWIYLWLPLLSIIAWGAGIQMLIVEVFLPDNYEDLQELLRLLVYVV